MPENLHFRSYDPDQTLLFPQRIDRDIPKDDPVRILKSVIESLDLSGFKNYTMSVAAALIIPK